MAFKTHQTDLKPNPAEVFEGLVDGYDNCFLFESLGSKQESYGSGQSYIGVEPAHVFMARDGKFYEDGKAQLSSVPPYAQLKSKLRLIKGQPGQYIGGLAGYLSHEAMAGLEPSLELKYQRQFPDFQFGEYQDGLTFKAGQPPKYFHHGANRLGLYRRAAPSKPAELEINFAGSSKNQSQYQVMVEKARRDIQAGRVFQVVLANKYDYRFNGQLFELYKQLRTINPSPFMFFIKFGPVVTLGASPELLTHTTPARFSSIEALAGTIRRGRTAAEDTSLAAQLLQDDKELAEHDMLVDLVRNDLGRVSRIGSVKIDRLAYIKKLSHVQHICTLVSGQLAAGQTAFDALAATFPAGTLVGAPKIEAAKMIAELEAYERGPYGGTVGYFSYNGDSMQAVNIRSLQAVGRKLFVHTGSGIVYDSQAKREYQEVSDKKRAVDEAMRPFLEAAD